jgi:hypothetical protein
LFSLINAIPEALIDAEVTEKIMRKMSSNVRGVSFLVLAMLILSLQGLAVKGIV